MTKLVSLQRILSNLHHTVYISRVYVVFLFDFLRCSSVYIKIILIYHVTTPVVRDLFHVFLNNVKIIVCFLIYKPGIKVLLDIMLLAFFLNT